MKTRETKHKDLSALTESLQNSKSAMVVSFTKLTVSKDQEFRKSVREAGAKYQVVKNTLARIAVKGTQFEDTTDHLKGVTAIAWTENDPVVLSKAISKFMKDNADIYTFKTGVVEGKLVDFKQLMTIANLPSKDDLISQLLYVLNSGAQRIVTVINAVPRDLAVVIKQIGEQKGGGPVKESVAAEAPVEVKAEEITADVVEEAGAAEAPVVAEINAEVVAVEETSAEAAETVDVAAAEATEAKEAVTEAIPETDPEAKA